MTSSSDPFWSGVDVADVSAINIDNETAFFYVAPLNLTTTEASGSGHTATFTILLSKKPTADVTIPLTSLLTTEGTVSP